MGFLKHLILKVQSMSEGNTIPTREYDYINPTFRS